MDFENRILTLGRAKTSSGTGRESPMNNDRFVVLSAHADFISVWQATAYRPDAAHNDVKDRLGQHAERSQVSCRLEDLRHTTLTKMAEADTPESTMLGWPAI